MGPATGVRTTGALHLLAGAGLVLVPERVLGRKASQRRHPTSAVLLSRLLGARHVVEGLWLLRTGSGSAHVPAGAIEVVHIGSMAVWRPSSTSLRSFARRGSALSTAMLLVHGALASVDRSRSEATPR